MDKPTARLKPQNNEQLFQERINVNGNFIRGYISDHKLMINNFMNGGPIPPRVFNAKTIDCFINELTEIKKRLR